MRDYPSVPNVFRVASSHSINNEGTYAPVNVSNGAGLGANSNSNVSQRNNLQHTQRMQLQQQQQQQQQQQHQQNSLTNSVQHKLQQQQSLTLPAGTAVTALTAGAEPRDVYQQQTQEQQNHHGLVSIQQNNQSHRLTTTASIERNYSNGQSARQTASREQQSPYATLPRTISGLGNGDLRQQQFANNKNGNNSINGRTMTGVINTISGSIPATGFSNGCGPSIGSDLNLSLNNSCTDLDKLNGAQKHHMQQRQQHQQQHQQQQLEQQREYRITRTGVSDYHKRENPCARMERNNAGYLWILTPVAASISVAIVIAALAGPQWLFTEEKLPNANYNGTANFNALDDGAFITKYTKSSLWILCTALQGVETYNCIKIDYFPKEGYQPDPLDSTPAIPYTVTKSCPFFLASGVFLLLSFIVFLIPTCSHQNNLYYFSAGIMFIVSGLLMLIGLIAYISILKAEIGSKLRPRSTLQPALFKVTYGQSFFLFVFGFIATEFVGLLNIFLYISLQEIGYYSRLPCFTISNLHEKIKEGENPRSHTYKSYKHVTEQKQQQKRTQNHSQRRTINGLMLPPIPPSEMDLEGKKFLQQIGSYACRKHPNVTGSNLYLNNDLDQRYYFEKPPSLKCNLHSKNLAKSLNELYTEPAPPVGPPPPPSTIKVGARQTFPRYSQQHQHHQQQTQFGELPQEFPLTRSISTTTDIFTNASVQGNKGNGNGSGNACISRGTATPNIERKNRRNMATNTNTHNTETQTKENERKSVAIRRHPTDTVDDLLDEEPHRLCGLKRGIRKTKDELFQEFCKRAGMRPKPKNIYYIENEENGLPEVDDDENDNDDVDNENGFHQLHEDEDEIYVVDDIRDLQNNPLRNMRRASMYVEPTHLRKLNSNLSLHILQPPEKFMQKSLFDLERSDSTNDMSTHYPEFYFNKGAYGGSQNRLQHDYNPQVYQSRTLPRSFLKKPTGSQDSLGSASLHASATALHNAYSASQNRLTNLMLQHQQQLQQQNRFLSMATHKSCEDLNSNYPQAPINVAYATTARPQQPQQQASINSNSSNNNNSINNNNNNNTLQQPIVQWPAAIPSSPSNFPNKYQIYAPVSNNPLATHLPHNLVTRSVSGGAATTIGNAPPKFQRGYAFDEQRRASAVTTDAFDLDEIERERRRSHASLFGGINGVLNGGSNVSAEHYDLINGTAV